eukprot:COSAG05_NODE_3585_length_1977_cov_9.993078_2_plen_487_part_00
MSKSMAATFSGANHNTDLILVDGGMGAMESYVEAKMPWTTMGICLPHSADRIFDDLFHEGTRTLTDLLDDDGKAMHYECTGSWTKPLADRVHKIADFIVSHEMPRAMFLKASRRYTPRRTTGKVSEVGIEKEDKAKKEAKAQPTMIKKRCETRMASEFYQFESVDVTCHRAIMGMVTDDDVWDYGLNSTKIAKGSFEAWVATQNSEMRKTARAFKALVTDDQRHRESVAFCEGVMKPLAADLVRLGDRDEPMMGFVWKNFEGLYSKIETAVKENDLETFDHARLKSIEEIVRLRWQYAHCTYHSVGFMLNPLYMDVDLNGFEEATREELMADFKKVSTRLFYDATDPDAAALKTASALLEFSKFKSAGPHKDRISRAMLSKIQQEPDKYKLWDWWATQSSFPHLSIIADKVLSKQVGIGAVERSHKQMKKHVFSQDRPSLNPKQANMECFVKFNLPTLDNESCPDWVEEMDDNDIVVPDSETQASS